MFWETLCTDLGCLFSCFQQNIFENDDGIQAFRWKYTLIDKMQKLRVLRSALMSRGDTSSNQTTLKERWRLTKTFPSTLIGTWTSYSAAAMFFYKWTLKYNNRHVFFEWDFSIPDCRLAAIEVINAVALIRLTKCSRCCYLTAVGDFDSVVLGVLQPIFKNEAKMTCGICIIRRTVALWH